eukprot:14607331-Alexandrium_andersonii.AAC.1
MSASLVGSEMCIRDSFFQRDGQPTVGAADADLARAQSFENGHRHAESACLLYTSDAADDM